MDWWRARRFSFYAGNITGCQDGPRESSTEHRQTRMFYKSKRRSSVQLPNETWRGKIAFLLKLAIPSIKSREVYVMLWSTLLLLIRAFLAVRIARKVGKLGKVAVQGQMRPLLLSIAGFIASCAPAAVLNSSLDYWKEMLDLYFRENLTVYFDSRYFSDKVFFRLAGLHDVDNVDQRVTEDIKRWCHMCSHLSTSITRPLVETVTFTTILSKLIGWKATGAAWGYYLLFVYLVKTFGPNTDWLANQRMQKEGAFRAAHQSLLGHAEEVCISHGSAFTEDGLNRLFKEVTDQARYASYVHARFNLLQTAYTKYGSVLVGYAVCCVGVSRTLTSPATTVEDLSGMLAEISYSFKIMAKNVGHLLWNIKSVAILNGYSQRLYQLVEALDVAEFEVAQQNDRVNMSPRGSRLSLNALADCLLLNPLDQYGRVVRGDHIEFMNVPLMLPNGEVLCPSLSFHVKPGMNLLIMGPNGCGKSSTFRVLGELWPLRGGRITKPEKEQMYYVPQRPYMYDGTLFEQIIYPLRKRDVSVGEADLYTCLEMAGLDYIFNRPHISWNARLSWRDDSLSLGEKQRLAMARLFFHRPRFAILDECSSLIDLDVEQQLYERCHELGITLITIAHRRTVWHHHNWILNFDGNGGYMFSPLRLEGDDSALKLVLTNIVSASDASMVGKEVVLQVSDLKIENEEENEADVE
ncbi:ATP-binding protein cassette, subfamily D (ALD), member 2 [Strigomonas culicis]|uniref:ATP-binding protein cassette, subfamily D (ALD), member 2 n=1 Tax=Strigomonas culicis TaxID=28005 RepID=S9TSK0_9TRYP|nr:ATP-binding protein cassette, subfamily D (ALD), member 2 [Strigomonas culicis]|eukprot:EPY19478.1 ATP-binding protein cassette, subfamily D (ALD), member 2 [Strigomonas culicis]